MKLKLFFFLLLPFLGISQVQIGQDILGNTLGDEMGYSVAISSDGKIIATGAPGNDGNGANSGLVRVYENISGVWVQLGADIYGESHNSWGTHNGYSVSLSSDGKVLAIGEPFNDPNSYSIGNGRVKIFKYVSGSWSQIGTIYNALYGSSINLGSSVSLSSDGNTVAIGVPAGVPSSLSNRPGYVSIFKNIGGVWVQQGADIYGKNHNDYFGRCVSLSADGTTVGVGATIGGKLGYASVYKYVSGTWIQVGQDLTGKTIGDFYAESVSLSSNGNFIAIGAYKGIVNVYENISGVWYRVGNEINETNISPVMVGRSVSLSSDGKVLATRSDFGARIYENINNNWVQKGVDIHAGQNQYFGWAFGLGISISEDGDTVVIGGPSMFNKKGAVRVYDLTKTASSNQFVLDNFNIYPNPASDILNISLESNLVFEKAVIYNNLGQIVKETNQEVVDVSTLAKGIYFVEVTTNQGKATKKVIIK